ncbi:hypothetical protein CPC08DRAFT_701697, partial [Agrocybe pediades]
MSGISESTPGENGREQSETQRSLQQASVALEVALSRIREVRRSLLQLSESLPAESNTPRTRSTTAYNDIRPAHNALLLSGGLQASNGLTEPRSVTSSRSPANMNRLTSVERPPLAGPDESSTFSAWPNAPDTTPRFHSLPLPNVLPPRFTRRDHGIEFRYALRRAPDTGSTAREANTPDSALDFSMHARESDRVLERLQTRRNDVSSTSALIEQQERLIRSANALLNEARQAAAAPLNTLPYSATTWLDSDGLRRSSEARNDPLLTAPRIPRQELLLRPVASPSSASRSAAIEESVDTVSGDGARVQSRPSPAPVGGIMTSMISDMPVNYTSLISDEEFSSWLIPVQDSLARDYQPLYNERPSNLDSIRVTQTTDTTVSYAEDSLPRRGWARLDADGNAISVDEEEVIERARTEQRLRALERARVSSEAPSQRRDTRTYENSGRMHRIFLDSTLDVPHALLHTFHTDVEEDITRLYVDPLPMPLASMITLPQKPDDIYVDIVVPKHTYLAG